MSDQQSQAPTTGTPDHALNTPDTSGIDGATIDQQQAAGVDYEKRYRDLEATYTRTSQEAAEYKRLIESLGSEDPSARQQAAERLGIQFVDEQDDDTQADPFAQLIERQNRIEAQLAQRDEQAAQAQQMAVIEQHVDTALNSLGSLSDAQKDWIVSRAVAMPKTPEGMPDVAAAHRDYVALIDAEKQQWAQAKRAAPHFSSAGQQGTGTPALTDMTADQRIQYMTERAQANMDR